MKMPSFLYKHKPTVTLGTYGPGPFRIPLRIPLHQALTHVHVVGKSGSGKSRWLAAWLLTLLNAGIGVTLIDPHGTLAQLVLRLLVATNAYDQPGAYQKIIYLDLPGAARAGKFLRWNILKQNESEFTIAAHFKSAMHRAFPELSAGAASFDTLLPRAIRVLLAHNLRLAHLERFLLDQHERERLLATFDDDNVVMFFRNALGGMRSTDQLAYVGSVLRRAQLLNDLPVLKYTLSSSDNLLPIRPNIDQGQCLIVNLALPEEEASRLLGCLLVVAYEQAAMSRADLPADVHPKPHVLILDEFAEMVEQSEQTLTRILSMCRKHSVYLVMGHQTYSQTSEQMRGALQNTGMRVVMKQDRPDAQISSLLLGKVDPLRVKHTITDPFAEVRGHPVFYSLDEQWNEWAEAIMDLERQEAFIRTPDGTVAKVKTLDVPDPQVDPDKLAEIEEYYLTTYFRAQQDTDADLHHFHTPQTPTITRVKPIKPNEETTILTNRPLSD